MASEPILIVDDTPFNLKLLSVLLTANGYQVRTAATAEEALRVLETFSPVLLLLDLRLPGMDGLTLARHLRAQSRYDALVIVAVTASAMKGDEAVARAAGCDGYVSKPIDTRAFPQLVRDILARGRSR